MVRTRSRAERTARLRRVGWAATTLSVAGGVLAVVSGYLVQSTPEDRTPVPLALGEAYIVPERVWLVGDLVVYGSPEERGRPDPDELGCVVTEGGGGLSVERAAREDRIVVGGVGQVPLVSFPGRTGYGLVCAGPASATAAPLYVVPGANARAMVPLAAYSAAALLIPVGTVGLVMLRAGRD